MRDLNEYDIIRPEAESLIQSARSFGYTIETALSDLVDNSITAAASEINITFGTDHYNSFVRIEDNGNGMDEETLVNALRMGSFSPTMVRNEKDLGRFGLGLKTASFSQCRRLTVITRQAGGNTFVRCMDLDCVASKKDWILFRDFVDDSSSQNGGDLRCASGTIVLLEKLDRLMENSDGKTDKEHLYRKFENVRKHLSLIFNRFIESAEVSIRLFDEAIEPLNPFHISEKIPTAELQEEQLSIKGQPITIQPYILPHESKLSDDERGQLQIIKGLTDHQGIYLYRNRRLISDGGWLDLDFRKKESQRLCRIAIDIPNTLDEEWQIDVRKASAKIPDVIRKRIKNICFLAIEKAIKVYTHRGAYVRRKGEKKELIYLWLAKQKRGIKSYHINEKHPIYQLLSDYFGDNRLIFRDYLRLIAEAVPVSLIVNDFSDPSTVLETPLNNQAEKLNEIYIAAFKVMTDVGLSDSEAKRQLDLMDVFQKINYKA